MVTGAESGLITGLIDAGIRDLFSIYQELE